jgi:dTDP-4-dehydrorhamnose 3,5-epimerase
MNELTFTPTEIAEVLVVKPAVHADDRGFFLETHHQEKYAKGGIPDLFLQDNHSFSKRGVLRGLHAQVEHPQGKLVQAIQGEIFDVAVDIRPDSPTFRQWVARTLSGENHLQLWIPSGFAHGFCVLSETAHVHYKCTSLYNRDAEIGILWSDPSIGIDWPVEKPLLSPKDRDAEPLETFLHRLREHGRKDPP